MIVKELLEIDNFKVLNPGTNIEKTITKPFCCDLLSIAMSKAPAGAAWVTIMGNINTLAVASLTDCSCIVLASGIVADANMLEKAKSEGISVFSTELPIFEAALEIYKRINA